MCELSRMNEDIKTLGDFPEIRRNIAIWDKRCIKALYFFIFNEEGNRDHRARIRDFTGFQFSATDERFAEKVKLVREKLSKADLVSICAILNISNDARDLMRHIFNHLTAGNLLRCDCQCDSDGIDNDQICGYDIDDVYSYEDEENEIPDDEDDEDEDDDDDNDNDEEEVEENEVRDDEDKDGENEIDDDECEDDVYEDEAEKDEFDDCEEDIYEHGAAKRMASLNKQIGKQGSKNIRPNYERTGGQFEDAEKDLSRILKLFNLSFKDILNSIRPYNGSGNYSVESWVEEFEKTACSLELNEIQMLFFAKKSLKGRAKSFVEGEKWITTWEELKMVLLKEFRSRMNSVKLHEMLKERKKKRNESAVEYFVQMKKIAKQGSLEDLDLIEYTIDGIPDDRYKIILYGAKTLPQFREKLKNYDLISNKQKKTEKPLPSPSTSTVKGKGGVENRVPRASETSRQEKLRCFNCRKLGHKSSDCKEIPILVKCYKCNRPCHLSANCETAEEDIKTVVAQKFNGLPKKEVFLKGKRLYAMVDSGSQLNLMNATSHRRIGSPSLRSTVLFLRGFGKAKVPSKGYFEDEIQIDGNNFTTRFYVVSDDVLKKDVIIGSALLQEAEFIFRRNEILIRKIKDDEDGEEEGAKKCRSMQASEVGRLAEKAEHSHFRGQTDSKDCNKKASILCRAEEIARGDIGRNQDLRLQRVIHEQQTIINGLQNAVKNEKEKALEYQQKVGRLEEYFKNLGQVNNQLKRESTDAQGNASKTSEPCANSKNEQNVKNQIKIIQRELLESRKMIQLQNETLEGLNEKLEEKEQFIKSNIRKLHLFGKGTEDDLENMQELQRKCLSLEKSLVELAENCERLKRENMEVFRLLSEEGEGGSNGNNSENAGSPKSGGTTEQG